MRCIRLAALAGVLGSGLFAQRVGAPTDELTKLGVDELFNIQVTSVGRKAQELSKAPAAVFVLTAEDIRRSGATSIPEALRWVPGLTVLSIDERSWVVSARGSAHLYSDKILVMIDGRSLYRPLFSGVIWDAIDVPLGDIDRIEVVRGPVAVMWGPNAVNGVINIITKRAQATQGGRASAAAGNSVRGNGEARWGGSSGDRFAYRVWGKGELLSPAYGSSGYYRQAYPFVLPSLTDLDSAAVRGGFRLDGQPTDFDQVTVQGDVFKRGRHDTAASLSGLTGVLRDEGHTDYLGGSIQGKWAHTSAKGAETVLQFSYDQNQIFYPFIRAASRNLVVDFQRRAQAGEHNEIYWGAGYQQYSDETTSTTFSFDPANAGIRSADLVFRDEWQPVPGKLALSAGVRLDYLSYHRLEYQPSFRLLYTPNARQSFWAAYSRAVRAANRFDRNLRYNGGLLVLYGLPIQELVSGSTNFRSEVARSLEAGYRVQSGQRWSVDVSVFGSVYERLRSVDFAVAPKLVATPQGFAFQLPMTISNSAAGHSFGGEIWATVQMRPRWRLMPGYAYARDEFWTPASSPTYMYMRDRIPSDLRNQALLRSRHDLGRAWHLDLMARARGRDAGLGSPGVLLLYTRLGWEATRTSEISFTCNNIANRRVLEGVAEGPIPSIPIRRTFLVQWSQRF